MRDDEFRLDRNSLLEHAEAVRRLARALLDVHDAEDVSQEAMLLALRAAIPQARLGAWLRGAVRNLARGLARGRRRRAERERRAATSEVLASTFAAIERLSEQRRVLDAVAGLDEPYRTTIVLRFFEDVAPREIARRMGAPVDTVRTRLKRAIARLRSRLRAEHGGDDAAWCLALLPFVGLESNVSWKAFGGGLLVATKAKIALAAVGLAVGLLSLLVWSPWEGPTPSPVTALATSQRERADSRGANDVRTSERKSTEADVRPFEVPELVTPPDRPALSTAELRQLLLSSRRFDQVRAIDGLVAQATPAAVQVLLDALLTSTDPILVALLEEALLDPSIDVAPELMKAMIGSTAPETLAKLARMLTQLATSRPDVEHAVVALLVQSFDDPDSSEETSHAIADALVALGRRAVDPLTAYLTDAHTDPKGAGAAAAVLSRLDAAHGDAVRDALNSGIDAMRALLDDPEASAAEKESARQKIGSIAWAASHRPPEEQDALARDFLQRFESAADEAEAGTLAWGIAHLDGLSDQARLQTVESLLAALPDQPDRAHRQSYVWAVSQLVAAHYDGRDVDASFHDIVDVAQEAWNRHQSDPQLAGQLQRLLDEVRALESRKPRR
jgi:RNA polymerase sigma factor (sigma-70 family)